MCVDGWQDEEPGSEQMQSIALFRPHFVESFPNDYKPYVVANERGKGLCVCVCVCVCVLAYVDVFDWYGLAYRAQNRELEQVCARKCRRAGQSLHIAY